MWYVDNGNKLNKGNAVKEYKYFSDIEKAYDYFDTLGKYGRLMYASYQGEGIPKDSNAHLVFDASDVSKPQIATLQMLINSNTNEYGEQKNYVRDYNKQMKGLFDKLQEKQKSVIAAEKAQKAAEQEAQKMRENAELEVFKLSEHPDIYADVCQKVRLPEYIKANFPSLDVTQRGNTPFCMCNSPFWESKNPTVLISTEKNSFVDLAATLKSGEGVTNIKGNVVDFVANAYKVTPEQAVQIIAEQTDCLTPKQEDIVFGQRNAVLDINEIAADFYHENLMTTTGEHAEEAAKIREYLHKRGLTDKTIEKFRLGYAFSDSFHSLQRHLLDSGFSHKQIELAGLERVKQSDNGTVKRFDYFVERVTFPIEKYDAHNETTVVMGFDSRYMGDNKSFPRYQNSRNNDVYDKSSLMFGFDKAQFSTQNSIVVVEGIMDCISAHQCRFDNVVALNGSALTDVQAKMLADSGKNVVLALDNDDAGRKQTVSAWDTLKKAGYKHEQLSVMTYPSDCKDFNEMLQKKSVEEIMSFVEKNSPVKSLSKMFSVAKADATTVKNELARLQEPYLCAALDNGRVAFATSESGFASAQKLSKSKKNNADVAAKYDVTPVQEPPVVTPPPMTLG